MATNINSHTYFQAQTKLIKTIYTNSNPTKPMRYPEVFNTYAGDAERNFWTAMSIAGFGTLAQKNESEAAIIDASREGRAQTFSYTTYALRYMVSKEAYREDARKIIPSLAKLLRYSSDQTKEFLYWQVFNQAFPLVGNSGVGMYNVDDGQALCSNAHTTLGGQTFSNYLGAVALTVETLQQAYTLMSVMPDDRGLTTSRTPQMLIYPVGLHQNVTEVLNSSHYPTSGENRVNAVFNSTEPHPIEYLTSPSNGPFPWFVLAGKGELGSDAHTAFATTKWDEQRSWYDDNVQSLNHETEFRTSFGVVTPRGVVGSAGA